MKRTMTDMELLKAMEIPEIVNEKCCDAYDFIRQESASQGLNTMGIRKLRKKTVALCAAAAVVVMSTIPVAAYFTRNAFDFTSHEVYTKDPMQKNDLTPYAKQLDNTVACTHADITVQSVYCDGESLGLSFALVPKSAEFDRCTAISADLYLKLDGELVESRLESQNVRTGTVSFNRADDGVFYGVFNDLSSVKLTRETQLDIKLAALKGVNGKYRKWKPDDPSRPYASGTYLPEETQVFGDIFEFSQSITPDTSDNRVYEVNETQGDITLKSLFVSPFKMVVDIDGLGDRQSFRVKDQDGNELPLINAEDDREVVSVPYKTSTELTIEVFSLNVDGFPAECSFTVPIEKGFGEKWNVEYDDSDVVYDPPYEELEKYWEEESNKQTSELMAALEKVDKVSLGVTVDTKGYLTDAENEGKEPVAVNIAAKITGSRYDDISEYDVDPDRLAWNEENIGVTSENSKMLLVDYEITNDSDISGRYCFCGYDIYSKDMEHIASEPDYISYKDNGGKDSYMYDFKPHESKKITLGYMVSEDIAKKQMVAFVYIDNSCELSAANVKNGQISVMEIN